MSAGHLSKPEQITLKAAERQKERKKETRFLHFYRPFETKGSSG
jgi:hypothetical protein